MITNARYRTAEWALTTAGRIRTMVRYSNRFLLGVSIFISLSSPGLPPEATAEVLNVDAAYREAVVRGDVDRLATVFADNVLIIHSDGTTDTKVNFLNAISSGRLRMQSYERTHVQVRVFGAVAVLYSQTRKVFTYKNTPGVDVDLSTVTYLKQASQWKIVMMQNTHTSQ